VFPVRYEPNFYLGGIQFLKGLVKQQTILSFTHNCMLLSETSTVDENCCCNITCWPIGLPC
jgi:hypothetical protein